MRAKTIPKKMVRADIDWSMDGTQPPLPEWLEIRDVQIDAVERVCKEFDRGARVVMLDAPTGTGKTILAELVRRRLGVKRGLYVCTTKSLQAQVARDFPYARVLKGRTNYTPTSVHQRDRRWAGGGLEITCGDCDRGPARVPLEEQTCTYCEWVEHCPYQVARREAHAAPVGVLNTSYLLTECNGPGRFSGRELVVADEADLLEDELLGYVELRIGKGTAWKLGIEVPKKGSHMTTIRGWLKDEVRGRIDEAMGKLGRGVEERREGDRLGGLKESIDRVLEREDGWVREGDEESGKSSDALVLKPVKVDDVAARYLWSHGQRWLCMSGTTVSAEGQADALGLEAAGVEWGLVEVPMQFAKENRRVVFAPVGNMTRKGQEAGGVAQVLRGIERVLERHPDVNVLIHSHTYKLADEIAKHIKRSSETREVMTYRNSWGRDGALDVFRASAGKGGGILVAASMDRGVDLPGDLCRVQIIAKVPMASMGSRQVSERMHAPGGDAWYTMQTVRNVMQMCGRAVRGQEDYAVTYILDEHFGKLLKDGKRMGMWAQWWLDGLEVGRVREYV